MFVSYTMDVLGLPTLTAYYDFGKIDGLYGVLSLSHSVPLYKEVVAMDFRTAMGAAGESYLSETFAFPGDADAGREAFVPADAGLLDWHTAVSIPMRRTPCSPK